MAAGRRASSFSKYSSRHQHGRVALCIASPRQSENENEPTKIQLRQRTSEKERQRDSFFSCGLSFFSLKLHRNFIAFKSISAFHQRACSQHIYLVLPFVGRTNTLTQNENVPDFFFVFRNWDGIERSVVTVKQCTLIAIHIQYIIQSYAHNMPSIWTNCCWCRTRSNT